MRVDLGLLVGAIGAGMSSVASLVGQAAQPGGAGLEPWLSGGGAAAAVAGIVYIARLMATGKLVARDPAAEAARVLALAERVTSLAEDAREREDRIYTLLTRRDS